MTARLPAFFQLFLIGGGSKPPESKTRRNGSKQSPGTQKHQKNAMQTYGKPLLLNYFLFVALRAIFEAFDEVTPSRGFDSGFPPSAERLSPIQDDLSSWRRSTPAEMNYGKTDKADVAFMLRYVRVSYLYLYLSADFMPLSADFLPRV